MQLSLTQVHIVSSFLEVIARYVEDPLESHQNSAGQPDMKPFDLVDIHLLAVHDCDTFEMVISLSPVPAPLLKVSDKMRGHLLISDLNAPDKNTEGRNYPANYAKSST